MSERLAAAKVLEVTGRIAKCECFAPVERGDVLCLENDALDQRTLEAAAKKATSFLVGDPAEGVPLRNPTPHEIADAIRALAQTAPADGQEAECICSTPDEYAQCGGACLYDHPTPQADKREAVDIEHLIDEVVRTAAAASRSLGDPDYRYKRQEVDDAKAELIAALSAQPAPGAVENAVFVRPCAVEGCDDAHTVRFKVGVQEFHIGPDYHDTKAEAEWFRAQFLHAIRALRAKEKV